MRIGILTFCYAHNYGALLQCYAMKQLLSSKGHAVDVIGFEYKKLDDTYIKLHPSLKELKSPIKALKKQIKQLSYIPFHSENIRIWNEYERFIHDVIQPVDISEGQSKYDIVFCGSDQIWNPVSLKGFKREFFGNIPGSDPVKVALAPSCGNINEIMDNLCELTELARKMDFISARETKLAELLTKELTRSVPVLIDPSLIVEPSIYKKIEHDRLISEPYILVYNKNGLPGVISEIGERIGKENNAKVIEITTLNAIKRSSTSYIRMNGVAVEDFLSLVRDSMCVVTDAFHGVAFSLIYEKQFYFVECLRTERIYDLLNRLNLSSRAVGCYEDTKQCPIDYNIVNTILEKYRLEAMNFIDNALDYADNLKSL